MSCNPAMGGLGKGHLIREIDALGGIIGVASDMSGIQFRMLNRTRGEAVQGPRAQIDRNKYKANVLTIVENERINIIEDEVVNILTKNLNSKQIVTGVETVSGKIINCGSLVVTSGTFLTGQIFMGAKKWNAGRLGNSSSKKLAKFFMRHKFNHID